MDLDGNSIDGSYTQLALEGYQELYKNGFSGATFLDFIGNNMQGFSFQFEASFVNDEAKGFSCECCRVRQQIKWSNGPGPHVGFDIEGINSTPDFVEDRSDVSQLDGGTRFWEPRYGERDRDIDRWGNNFGDQYYDTERDNFNYKSGCNYWGQDTPQKSYPSKTRSWTFKLEVLDTCVEGEPEVLASTQIWVGWIPSGGSYVVTGAGQQGSYSVQVQYDEPVTSSLR